jgi:hypothetical protein
VAKKGHGPIGREAFFNPVNLLHHVRGTNLLFVNPFAQAIAPLVPHHYEIPVSQHLVGQKDPVIAQGTVQDQQHGIGRVPEGFQVNLPGVSGYDNFNLGQLRVLVGRGGHQPQRRIRWLAGGKHHYQKEEQGTFQSECMSEYGWVRYACPHPGAAPTGVIPRAECCAGVTIRET